MSTKYLMMSKGPVTNQIWKLHCKYMYCYMVPISIRFVALTKSLNEHYQLLID